MKNLTEKVIIISGASAGIGRATAVACARAGAHVVLCARNGERLTDLAADLEVYPGSRIAVPGDIGEPETAAMIIAQTMQTFGRVDILLNNAGIGHRSLLADMPPADMQRLIDTNVLGLLYLTQAVVPQMKVQGRGHIINISSIIDQRPLPNMGLYCASKTAVNFLSRTLRIELRPYNIMVSTVHPGRTQTEFGARLLGSAGTNPSAIGRVTAAKAARTVVKTMLSGKAEVYVTPSDWLFAQVNRLFPGTTDWLVTRLAGVWKQQQP